MLDTIEDKPAADDMSKKSQPVEAPKVTATAQTAELRNTTLAAFELHQVSNATRAWKKLEVYLRIIINPGTNLF